MTLWDVPPDKLKAPDVQYSDFKDVLKHSFTSVSSDELKIFDDWTR